MDSISAGSRYQARKATGRRRADRRQAEAAAYAADPGTDKRPQLEPVEDGHHFELAARGHDQLTALAVHDIRSALNAMVGWLHMLQGDAAGPALRERAAAGLQAAVGMQKDLVDGVSHVAPVVSGRDTVCVQCIAVVPIVAQAIDRGAGRAASGGISIRLMSPSPDVCWYADPSLAKAALSALLAHCLSTLCRGRALTIAIVEDASSVTVAFEGCPMPSHVPLLAHPGGDLDSLLEPEEASLSGAGLMLTIAGTLASVMGGELVATGDGPGTASRWASLRLPSGRVSVCAAGEDDGPVTALASPGTGRAMPLEGIAVMVVDDRADMRAMIEGLLQLEGASVTGCESATEATEQQLAWSADAGLHLLLSDLSMPDIDGLALVRQWRQREREEGLGRVPAVALTAHADAYPSEQIIQAGFDLVLSKPVDPATFARDLSALLLP